MGRSRLELKGYVATLGDTFGPLGFAEDQSLALATAVTQLGVDLGSFNNVADSDAINALTSALVGNHETMRQFGVIITQATLDQELLNMGFKTSAKGATNQQKVMARLNIIFDGTSKAVGDAARTSGEFANRMKALQGALTDVRSEVGTRLNEALIELIADMGGVDAVADMAKAAMEDVADAAVFLVRNLQPAITEIKQLINGFELIGIAGMAITKLNPIVALVSASTDALPTFGELRRRLEELGSESLALQRPMLKANDALSDTAEEGESAADALARIRKELSEVPGSATAATTSLDVVNNTMVTLWTNSIAGRLAMSDLGDEIEDLPAPTRNAESAMFGMGLAFKTAATEAYELAIAAEDAANAADKLFKETSEAINLKKRIKDSTEALQEFLALLLKPLNVKLVMAGFEAGKILEQKEAAESLKAEFMDFGNVFTRIDLDFIESVESWRDAINQLGRDLANLAIGKLEEQLVKAIIESAFATGAATGGTDVGKDVAGEGAGGFHPFKAILGVLTTIAAFIATLISIVASLLTTIVVTLMGMAVSLVTMALQSAALLVQAIMQTAYQMIMAVFAPIPFFAHGGIVTQPTVGMIGEAGPEAIIPLDQLGSFGGGQPVVVNINAQVADAPFAEQVGEVVRREISAARSFGGI